MRRAEILTSAANPLLKEIRRAVARGSATRDGYCVAETFHLLDEALRSGSEVSTVLASESARAAVEERLGGAPGARLAVVSDAVFGTLSATEAAQGVMALVRLPEWTAADLFRGTPLVIVLDGIQDPGNAGAILRAAEAFGASGVIFSRGTVNPHNPKAVRASAGSVFRLPLVAGLDPAAVLSLLAGHGVCVWAAGASAPAVLTEIDLRRPSAFIIGNEGSGVGEDFRRGAGAVCIPVSGVESLNAAMAAGILLYEARRQRSVS